MRKNAKNHILLLEDDEELSATIFDYLILKGFEVTQVYNGYDARDKIYENSYDLLLFDIKVPYFSGFELLTDIRNSAITTPVIMITSLDDINSVEKGFNLGCDDYIRKPFALKELLVRVEAIIKRSFTHTAHDIIEISPTIKYDILANKLTDDTRELKLKTKEYLLLKYFLQNKNRILSKEEIFESIYDFHEEPSEGSLRAFINSIRKYIGKDSIQTVKNIGYIYVGC